MRSRFLHLDLRADLVRPTFVAVILFDRLHMSNAEAHLVANVEERTAMEADVQKHAAVLTDREHVVCPGDALLPIEYERAD